MQSSLIDKAKMSLKGNDERKQVRLDIGIVGKKSNVVIFSYNLENKWNAYEILSC